MFLYNCIGLTISNITNKFINLLYKCNYFINYSQLMRCLDKEYMYEKYCNITIETCNCIQNNILYNNSIYNVNYNLLFIYILISLTIAICCCKKKFIIINNSNSNSNISLQEEDDSTSNILDSETIDNNNYYVIDKNNTLPKYNEIDSEIDNINSDTTQITIVDNRPPKYNEID
jgi:hypothetical protein